MDKILVEVYFPSLSRTFDVYIPNRVRFYQVSDMIERAVSSITSGKYVASGCAVLCDRETGVLYDANMTADEMCLHSGSKLILI